MKIKLMILDDEQFIRRSLTDWFEDLGWQVYAFATAEEALLWLKTNKPDYATVDLRLPGMNGAEFLLKAYVLQPTVRCLIYSGSIDFFLSDELKAIGMTLEHFLLKPAESLNTIHQALLHLDSIKGN